MARHVHRLTALSIKNYKAKGPSRYADGNGLYLQVDQRGGCSWVFMWKRNGKRRVMGLGSESRVTLGEARKKAVTAMRALDEGRNPIAERRNGGTDSVSFAEAAAQCHAMLGPGWRSAKHRAQWLPLLEKHAQPLLPKAVAAITTDDVVRVLTPLWQGQTDLAMRLRERIQRVLNWAIAKKLRHGDNPARWEGNLQDWMPKPPAKRLRVRHLQALHYDKIPEFMARLRQLDKGIAVRALEFTILTAVRTGETAGATWDEINFEHRLWTIPGARMKMGIMHIVPLSERALQIVQDQYEARSSRSVFPGLKDNRPLSTRAMLRVLDRLGVDATVHGFRSTFRDWAGDLMAARFSRDVVELALAHSVGDATERAYRRGTALNERAELMAAWAAYCERPPQADNIIPMRAGS